jgi:hypothetical protein
MNGPEGRATIFGLGENSVRRLQQPNQHFQDLLIVVSDDGSRQVVCNHTISWVENVLTGPIGFI